MKLLVLSWKTNAKTKPKHTGFLKWMIIWFTVCGKNNQYNLTKWSSQGYVILLTTDWWQHVHPGRDAQDAIWGWWLLCLSGNKPLNGCLRSMTHYFPSCGPGGLFLTLSSWSCFTAGSLHGDERRRHRDYWPLREVTVCTVWARTERNDEARVFEGED